MSFQKTKVDSNLGLEVHEHLKKIGLETPFKKELLDVDAKTKIEKIEKSLTEVWETLGMDLSDDSLTETPKRIAKMMVLEHYWGLHPENFPKCTTIENKMHYDEMLIEKDITVMSNCEHHGVTIEGKAHVAYMPNGKVIGLSKIPRIVEYFSRRPQVQERLTSQIFETLKFVLGTDNVAVVIEAKHYCVISRGVSDQTAYTTTSALGGHFREDPDLRREYFNLVNKG